MLRVPRDLSYQRQVGEVLSAYDDLIENNRRRMGLLEEAAKQIYEEWFVRLRFPGHEHTEIIDGVPEAWERRTVDDLCEVGRGSSPRPISNYMGGTIPWFKIADATASESPFVFYSKEHVTEDGSKKSVLIKPGDLILSNSATCGIPFFAGVEGCIHDGWLHFDDLKRVSRHFLYCYFQSKREELVSSVGDGSTQKNLNTSAVGRLGILLPRSNALLDQFVETVGPWFSMIFNLARQNLNLRTARDLLLPRLMSGEIAV